MFQNTFFYFFQAVVILVQRFLGISQTQIIRCINTPWQTHHGLQVVQLYAVIRRLRMHTLQLIHFFQECAFYLFIPFYGFRFFPHFLYFLLLISTTQLILNSFNLLLQEIFTLLLVNVLAGTHLNRFLDFGKLNLTIQNLE